MALFPKFFFAWVDEGVEFDPEVHNVTDEVILGFRGEHREGDFPALNVDIENPHEPFLSASRKIWAWLSWQTEEGGDVEPLFHGRLVGIPKNILAGVVTLELVARPVDYDVQKADLAETLKEDGYFDIVWIDDSQLDNPDVVWETRDEIWHIDRVTHTVTSSNLIVGEDGNESFAQSEVPYDSVDVQFNEPPLRQVTVNADVMWAQVVTGEFSVFENVTFRTFGADNIFSSWPKTGSGLGGGYTVTLGEANCILDQYDDSSFDFGTVKRFETWVDLLRESANPKPKVSIPSGWLQMLLFEDFFQFYSVPPAGNGGSYKDDRKGLVIPYENVTGTLRLGYSASRARKESLTFTLTTDVQPILTMPDEQQPEIIQITGRDLGASFDEYPVPIIGDLQARSYFSGDRGQLSIQYLILLARAKLVARARAVDVSFDCRFERAVELSCRMSATLSDPRLPHGTATGKVTAYSYELARGVIIGHVTISCAIGRDGSVVTVPGDPTYSEGDYAEAGWEFYDNTTIALGAGSVGYTVPATEPNDDGLVFPLTSPPYVTPPSAHLIYPAGGGGLSSGGRLSDIDATTWGQLMQGVYFTPTGIIDTNTDELKSETYNAIIKRIKDYFEANLEAHIDFVLKPVTGGPFLTNYAIVTTDLKIPKTINLED